MTNAQRIFDERCVRGIEANREMCAYWVERSAALATALAPRIGYARAAELGKRSVAEGVLIRELVAARRRALRRGSRPGARPAPDDGDRHSRGARRPSPAGPDRSGVPHAALVEPRPGTPRLDHAHHHVGRVRIDLRAAPRAPRSARDRSRGATSRPASGCRATTSSRSCCDCGGPGSCRSTRGARGGYISSPARDSTITVRDIIQASELSTFDLHCISHPVDGERCADSSECSIRPVWLLLQQRIDEVLEGVRLADLIAEEATVRERVGLAPAVGAPAAGASARASRCLSCSADRWGCSSARREQRRRQAMSERYLAALLEPPPAAQVEWLASAGGIARARRLRAGAGPARHRAHRRRA